MKCTIIGITGGTGSGKSTFTNRLKKAFPDDVTVIYHDNYYRCQDDILLLTDPRVRELLDIKIYVDEDADERILRRITRDVKERGRDLDNIVDQYLTTVKPMHYLYVEPMRNRADIVVNSGMNDVAFDVVRAKIRNLLEEE